MHQRRGISVETAEAAQRRSPHGLKLGNGYQQMIDDR
jgi:hypothetical protein